MEIEGRGRILVWEGASLWLLEAAGGVGRADFHSHHAIQITLALEGDFELRTADERLRGPAVAVAADASHVFEASGLVAFLFVEPESREGRALAASFRGKALRALSGESVAQHRAALAAAFRSGSRDEEFARLGAVIVAAMAGSAEARVADPRIRSMIDHAGGNLQNGVSLPSAASAACLSESRARHLFVEQTGLPFKTYVLWLRIGRAVELYAAGASLTEAAHEAGFADSAHFSRTFRRTFGLPAAALRVNSRFVQAVQPDAA
ncbi:MAG: AraC family transcriptional regulator [Alphaproteobacteria bacterium]|nr:AraC family transcriptional regulator [Alphaproteobacteria bacterium]